MLADPRAQNESRGCDYDFTIITYNSNSPFGKVMVFKLKNVKNSQMLDSICKKNVKNSNQVLL
jgi:hypothetical protein